METHSFLILELNHDTSWPWPWATVTILQATALKFEIFFHFSWQTGWPWPRPTFWCFSFCQSNRLLFIFCDKCLGVLWTSLVSNVFSFRVMALYFFCFTKTVRKCKLLGNWYLMDKSSLVSFASYLNLKAGAQESRFDMTPLTFFDIK